MLLKLLCTVFSLRIRPQVCVSLLYLMCSVHALTETTATGFRLFLCHFSCLTENTASRPPRVLSLSSYLSLPPPPLRCFLCNQSLYTALSSQDIENSAENVSCNSVNIYMWISLAPPPSLSCSSPIPLSLSLPLFLTISLSLQNRINRINVSIGSPDNQCFL